MPEVQLSRADAQGGRLPPLCMQCGAPATAEVTRNYTTDTAPPPPPDPVIGGCLLFPIWLAIALLKLVSFCSARTMKVRTPLCDRHAHGWFTRSTLAATSITDENIALTGVAQEFVDALEKQRAAGHPTAPTVVKVRCRNCHALNAEAAKFCDQCGGPI
jgi:ribosomal protein L40E